MSDLSQEKRNFISHDYKEISVSSDKASLFLDGYENFGWQLDNSIPPVKTIGRVTLRFKRDRKIINKVELTRLQRHFEACINEIDALEASKSSAATAVSLTAGIVGTAFMAGSVFAVTAPQPMIALCVSLAIPGFVGWILPYLLYKKVRANRIEKVTPLIEDKYDEIYEILEKGNRLLND